MSSDADDAAAPANDDFLGVPDAAIFLGVAQSVVRVAMHTGRLPFSVAYGRKVVAVADLAAYKARTQPDGQPRQGRPKKRPDQPLGDSDPT